MIMGCLQALLLSHIYQLELTNEEGELKANWMDEVDIVGDGITQDFLFEGDDMQTVLEKVASFRKSLEASPTACLWMNFIDMVNTLCKSLEGERTGNFELRLESQLEMLWVFAAANSVHCKRRLP